MTTLFGKPLWHYFDFDAALKHARQMRAIPGVTASVSDLFADHLRHQEFMLRVRYSYPFAFC